jgi:peptidoglycan/LPS O-acetylase OafA/YrhL
MNRETSLYLDLVRFSASLIVMIGHLAGSRFTGGLFWRCGQFMDDAVIVFFVLSGFVIAHVVRNREVGIEKYAIARAARIYSVALPALIVTFLLDALGRHIAPELYSISWGYNPENPARQIISGVLFLNQLWYSDVAIGSMLPYWSLGFEVWYYLFFAIIYFVGGRWKIPLFLAACVVAGPRIVILFPIWMLGYCAYIYGARYKISRSAGLGLVAMSIVIYLAYYWLVRPRLQVDAVVSDLFGVNLVARYLVGLIFAVHLVGFVWASDVFRSCLRRSEMAIRWLAGATFTMYLFHLPVAQFLTTLVPWPPADWRTRLIILVGTFVVVLFIAEFTERKKERWNRWISRACLRTRTQVVQLGKQ